VLPRTPALAVAPLMLAGLLLVGCSGASSASGPTTITVTGSATSATPKPTPTPTPTPTATSDVAGRAFDAGTVSSTSTIAGVLVAEVDRWTDVGQSDASLGRKGVTIMPHTEIWFTNQNDKITFSVPIAPGAQVVVNTCVKGADGQLGMRSAPQSAASWLAAAHRSTLLVLAYDPQGRATRIDTDARCP
jgi:hypothetical protein